MLGGRTKLRSTLFCSTLQVIGESIKRLPPDALSQLSSEHRNGPARLRDLIAHHYFALDADILWDVAAHHVPGLLVEACALRERTGQTEQRPDRAGS